MSALSGRIARASGARWVALLGGLALLAGIVPSTAPPAAASDTPDPTSVTIVGSLQSELGCAGDWDPACAATHLAYDPNDAVWQGTWSVPAGSWEYKAALNDSWAENYGAGAVRDGANIPLNLGAPTPVKFYYDHETHWITDNQTSTIATVPGSFQSELGCSGDWDPGCLRSWLQDPDGDGTFSFSTTAVPAGNYEAKVAINESWDENYGAGGAPGGANIPFTVPAGGATVSFSWVASTKVLTITAVGTGPAPDDNVEWDGLAHDSRSDVYRTPGGAVPAGTDVTLRFRTFANDVTRVTARVYSLNDGGQHLLPMERVASGVSCYQDDLADRTCDFWQTTIDGSAPDNLWYRFIVTDGTDTDHYVDDTAALDGGIGTAVDNVEDRSWALMIHVPGFEAPEWASDAVIYQIFPDRFRDGRANNNPRTGDVRYDDPVLALPWNTLPEGYCRNYADGDVNCPWRFDDTPPDWSPTKEQPRGRDYMGGDLRGVDQRLDYLATLGVNTIYFNPIFDSGSNHGYDTQDYYRIDPYFGTQKDWDNLVKHADRLGIRIIVDGVFNHLSSDSPIFDRYHHYDTVGACESLTSPYRTWFTFTDVPAGTGTCVGSTGAADSATYEGWFGFDSIPVITKTLPEVQEYFLTSDDSVTRHWLEAGAAGWRLDVSGDASFPNGYWESFREVVEETDPDALTISETWQKDSTLLRMLRGDRLDTTMNYRLRDAVIGLLAVGPFDSKGFADSGRIIAPTEFASRIMSIREDYPDAAYYSLMNLLDSHDTERIRWTLTPGADTTADKELNAANVAEGEERQRIAALIQYTMPGAPTVFYGDEVGVTGDDDPDDRRTYPWPGRNSPGQDLDLLAYYTTLANVRDDVEALTDGDIRILAADDASGTVAYGRGTASQAAVVIVNRSDAPQTGAIPVAGWLPDGTVLHPVVAANTSGGGAVTVANGAIEGTLEPLSAVVLATGEVDLMPPAAPTNLAVTAEGNSSVGLAWDGVPGAAGYHVYASPLTGGGFVRVTADPVAGTSFTLTGLENGRTVYIVVTAVDEVGNESGWSNAVSAIPHLAIGWANLQWPPTMTHTISAVNRTDTAYGQVWIDGVTNQPGATPGLWAQLGYGPDGSNPATDPGWSWVDAAFNVDAGNNDEFQASLLPETVGDFDYVYRYSVTGGRDWLYADLDGPVTSGAAPGNPGSLTVNPSGDTTAPTVPTGLHVVTASPAGVELAWDAVAGDPSLFGYEVGRSDTPGGPYTVIGSTTTPSFTDTAVASGEDYAYVVRSVDLSFNRSGWSPEVVATAELRTVSVTFDVTVPATTDGTGLSVYIAGSLNRLDGGLPEWNPGGTVLTRVDATTWTITLTGEETTAIEYKYTLGSWDYVEKDGVCGEISNRQLTLSYGADGTQSVNDTVLNWRNVDPCGN